MGELRALLKKVDDDYLVGISNKGIVKRAYKDLAAEQPSLEWQGEEAHVSLREETCILRAPLGESSCSCPSRSICRHVITAALWLRQTLESEENREGVPRTEVTDEKVVCQTDGGGPVKDRQTGGESRRLEQVLALPVERLVRICGNRRLERMIEHVQEDGVPPFTESSVVTVTLPWEPATVKLLEPFGHSSCTCHSRELCVHKAQAALIYQLSRGELTPEQLKGYGKQEETLDQERVREACEAVCYELCHQISLGLSRQSPGVTETMERLAVISHRAGLPALEGLMRKAAFEYGQYFSRSASFRTGELLGTLLKAYVLGKTMERTESQEKLRTLAGTFRDRYEPAGNLHLLGVGCKDFHGRTGYEGEIYYFLEPEQRRWYTWTDVRPVFYEGVRRRPAGASGNMQAPWGLGCTRERMQRMEFTLRGAKAAPGGRLSVSRESRGESMGEYKGSLAFPEVMIERDYESLIGKYFLREPELGKDREERLVLVEAYRRGPASFDRVAQRFSWSIYDRRGRTLFLSLRYTKEEKTVIRLLERLEQRMRGDEESRMLVFGFLYMDEAGRLCLYPVEFFAEKTPDGPAGGDVPPGAPGDRVGQAEEPKEEAQSLPAREALSRFRQYEESAVRLVEDLFLGGLDAAKDDTAGRLLACGEEAEQLGLHGAGRWLSRMGSLLQEKRHRMEFKPEPVVEAMERFWNYMDLCGRKLACDRALWSMQDMSGKEGEESNESE